MSNKSNFGFWPKLKKPVICLAPMSDVTDTVFRQIIAKYGKPDVFFTEFISVSGLISSNQDKVAQHLLFSKKEKPIVAQVWGTKPEHFYQSAKLIKKLGFDGIDINMGCPERAVIKQGAGAALIEKPKLAIKIIEETKRAVGKFPVSIKTRLNRDSNSTVKWIKTLLKTTPAALTLHGRTSKQTYQVPADWSSITRAVKIRNQLKSPTLIIGNGDIKSLAEAKLCAEKTGVDGVMVGRAVMGNPWFFNPRTDLENIAVDERLRVLIEHAALFIKFYKESKNFNILKKFFCAYVTGFTGAKELRSNLMHTSNITQATRQIDCFIKKRGKISWLG